MDVFDEEECISSHLLKFASALPLKDFVIAQHILELCRSRLSRTPSLRGALRDSSVCSVCSTPWCFGQYTARIQQQPSVPSQHQPPVPSQQQPAVPGRRLRQLLSRHARGCLLNRRQRQLVDLCRTDRPPLMVLQCKVCQRTTRLPLKATVKTADTPVTTPLTKTLTTLSVTPLTTPTVLGSVGVASSASARKRNKRRSSSNAGLLIPAEMRTPSRDLRRQHQPQTTPSSADDANVELADVSRAESQLKSAEPATDDCNESAVIPLKKKKRRVFPASSSSGATTVNATGCGSVRSIEGADAKVAPSRGGDSAATNGGSCKQWALRRMLTASSTANRRPETGLMAFLSQL